MPSSRMAAMRPFTCTWPWVGCSVPVIIFSKVDLPAPFWPMIPIASPGSMAKLMCFSTQCSLEALTGRKNQLAIRCHSER
ncbi:hypothetical protein D3C75_1010510 [compost metagenome]